ncbi:MAG: hypothetical protein SGPRY_010088, partial [Prymnesium sp.]
MGSCTQLRHSKHWVRCSPAQRKEVRCILRDTDSPSGDPSVASISLETHHPRLVQLIERPPGYPVQDPSVDPY